MRKTVVSIMALLCALTLLCACTPSEKPGDEPTTEPSTPTVSPEQSAPAPSVDGPVYSGTDVAESPFVGRFENTYVALFASTADETFVDYEEAEDGELTVTPREKPFIVCREDGTFSITVDTLNEDPSVHKYATINGTFTVDGESAEFTVAAGSYGDFIGSDTQKFIMKLINAHELRYWGDQIGTVTGGDMFKRVSE